MNSFAQRYKNLSAADLLGILENEAKYQPQAIEAAKSELNQRGLSGTELSDAKRVLKTANEAKLRNEQKRVEKQEKIRRSVHSFVDVFRPVQKSPVRIERLITLVTIAFVVISLSNMFEYMPVLWSAGTLQANWRMSDIVFLFAPLLLPIASYLFWRRKKMGWIMLCGYVSFTILNTFYLLFLNWNQGSSRTVIDSILPSSGYVAILGNLFFFGGMFYILTKKDLLSHFEVSRQAMRTTVIFAALLFPLTVVILMF